MQADAREQPGTEEEQQIGAKDEGVSCQHAQNEPVQELPLAELAVKIAQGEADDWPSLLTTRGRQPDARSASQLSYGGPHR